MSMAATSRGGIHCYKPLSGDHLEIRTLQLEPSHSWSSEICCRLQHHRLEVDRPKPCFEALSYTWDSGAGTTYVWLDGRSHPVTPNLESFLRHRREPECPVDIWVDAICINQNDPKEKSSQIKRMNLIYATARRVIVWLGNADNDSDLAMDELRVLGSGSPYNKMPIITGRVLVALQSLLTRRWWSRVWIIQEIVWGGCGTKLDKTIVRCGNKELRWITLIIAAARMESHKDDLRQYFPTIKNIFVLENLRYQCGKMTSLVPNESTVFDIIARHRHFEATVPEDKIYALLGLAFEKNFLPFSKIKIDYTVSAQEAYKRFALVALRSPVGLNVLRHCHPRSIVSLPSWVPDWSTCGAERALPYRREAKSVMEPWWMTPIPIVNESVKGDGRISYRFNVDTSRETTPMRSGLHQQLPHGFMLNSIPKSWENTLSQECIDTAKELMLKGVLVGISAEEDIEELAYARDESNETTAEKRRRQELRILAKSEKVTRLKFQSKYVFSNIAAVRGYRSAGSTSIICDVDELRNTVTVGGILYDTIDILQDAFVEELAADWENATTFMVAIGKCKKIAVTDYTGPNPYTTEQNRIEGFWLALLAGQTTIPNQIGRPIDIKNDMPFQDWLPPIPVEWRKSAPPVTVVNSGRLESAQILVEGFPTTEELQKYFSQNKGSDDEDDKNEDTEYRLTMPGINMSINLQPLEWTDEDRKYYTRRFQSLGHLWADQEFDLYHRPFQLPTVVPDPYWEMRKSDPKFTIKNLKIGRHMTKPLASIMLEEKENQIWSKKLPDIVPMVPVNNLPPGYEKYALGRRFAITESGYVGLVPKGAEKGDRVSVLFGCEVPIILRKRPSGGFEVVGESYIHGIMEGEVIEKWRSGFVESGNIVLH